MFKGEQIRDHIRKLLDENHIQYKYTEHEETPTSADAARVRGTNPAEGAKAIILKGKTSGKNIMVVLSGDKRINMQTLKEKFGEKFEFEKPEIILERYGLIIGGVPPFGNLLGIPTYIDKSLTLQENLSFNCGLRTASIELSKDDFIKVTNFEILDFAE